MYLLTVILPLTSFLICALFGRFLGSIGCILLTTSNMFFSVLCTFFIFYEVNFCGSVCTIPFFYDWINIDGFRLFFEFRFDALTASMLLIINFISFLVHMYSASYMEHDPHQSRFMSYLSLFTFFMLVLVTSGNFVQLFIGWEGVGLASYLLINFWYSRLQANKSGLKAIIVNRFGDLGLFIAIAAIFDVFHSLEFSVVFSLTPLVSSEVYNFFGFEINKISFICFFLMLAAIGKSAQLGLHIWLPDAMEGPTPVSALIHAATMVTAGVFLLLRTSHLLEYSPSVLTYITIMGALTAFFAATAGLLQNDLKRVIAYSTCSQLGYMFFCCGISNYSASMFHLVNHAFFKALLFLSAGAIIHALNDEQDMRKMGGLYKILPFTYVMVFIGSLALMGFPFLTGFYSKDVILELTRTRFSFSSGFAYWLGAYSAFCTAFYSLRLISMTFLMRPNGFKKHYENLHEAPLLMGLPLAILAIFSIFFGYIFKDLFIGLGTPLWGNALYINPSNFNFVESEFLPISVKMLPVFFGIFGAILSFLLYNKFYSKICFLYKKSFIYHLYFFFNKRWYFDVVYYAYIIKPFLNFGYQIAFKTLDRGFIEILGPLGLTRMISKLSKIINGIQTGFIYHYASYMVLGMLFVLFCCISKGFFVTPDSVYFNTELLWSTVFERASELQNKIENTIDLEKDTPVILKFSILFLLTIILILELLI
jgi:NADH-ubiquinone oxidoreductase chain 5